MSLRRMLAEVQESLRPDEKLLELKDEVVNRLNELLGRHEVSAQAVGGGSVAKNTFLVQDHDIDIFVRFSLEYLQDEELLSDILEPVLKEFKPKRVHGSRDYFQFQYRGVDFEIIPVLAVDGFEKARNVTDMSPLHVDYWVSKSSKQEDEVRLAKQFCKSAGVYGAESYIRGFSGHVIDLLILHYGTFYELVKQAAAWKAPVVIDLEDHHEDALSAIDTAKQAPLVLVDPVQPERNAAAALSEEQFDSFINRCKAFVMEPSEEFFVVEEFDEKALISRLSRNPGAPVVTHVKHPSEDKEDVAGSRVRKAYERLIGLFEKYGFNLVEDGWAFRYHDESVLWFVSEEHSLPRLKEHQGPPVNAADDAERFRSTHDEVFEREGRLYATLEREVRLPEQVVESAKESLKKNVGVLIVSVERIED